MKFRSWIAAIALLGAAACGGEEEGQRVELGEPQREGARASWSPELTARVDSGNTAYAEGNFQEAADIFAAITEEYPDQGVPWFGLYMAEHALGNEEAAQEALEKAEEYSPGLGRMHDAATDSTQRVPMMLQGHPEIPEDHPDIDSMSGGAPSAPAGTSGR